MYEVGLIRATALEISREDLQLDDCLLLQISNILLECVCAQPRLNTNDDLSFTATQLLTRSPGRPGG